MTVNPVGVVGGGIGGLTTAIALRRVGLDATVFERALVSTEAGAGITLWPSALDVFHHLGILEAVLDRAAVIDGADMCDQHGIPLPDLEWTDVSGISASGISLPICIHRAALLEVLLDALGRVNVVHGAEFVRFEEESDRVELAFADGTRHAARIAVGADGLHSRVRAQLFPRVRARYGGQTVYRGVSALGPSLVGRRPYVAVSSGLRFGWEPLPDQMVYWFAGRFQPENEPEPAAGRQQALLSYFADWTPAAAELISMTPPEEILRNDVYELGPLDRVVAGRVALIGDAAHTIPPHAGAGACLAIEDAGALATALSGQPSLAEGLNAYEAARRDATVGRFRRADEVRVDLELGSMRKHQSPAY